MSVVKKRPLIDFDTKLCDIPRAWLEFIEPRIRREGTCWLWTGSLDHDGHPSVSLRVPGKTTRTTRRVARIVAEMFWDLRESNDVLHACPHLNCLNPNHFHVSAAHWSQENRSAIIARRATRVDRWNRLRQ